MDEKKNFTLNKDSTKENNMKNMPNKNFKNVQSSNLEIKRYSLDKSTKPDLMNETFKRIPGKYDDLFIYNKSKKKLPKYNSPAHIFKRKLIKNLKII